MSLLTSLFDILFKCPRLTIYKLISRKKKGISFMRIFYVYPILIQMLTLITCEMLAIKDVANSSRSV